jgi:UDP-4-amino-4,6-dideoxy-N-acetyl-beta-L-altrosamine N-acetyltransferase
MYKTDRVELVPFTEEYLPLYHRWRNDPDIMQFDQPGYLYPVSYEEIEVWFDKVKNSTNSYSFAIKVKDEKKIIGICALLGIDSKNRNCELSIVIGEKDYWGKGYGKETMNILMNLAFNEFNMHKIYLRVMSFNKRAIKLYESLGFLREGVLKESIYRKGKYYDVLIFGILQSQFRCEL